MIWTLAIRVFLSKLKLPIYVYYSTKNRFLLVGTWINNPQPSPKYKGKKNQREARGNAHIPPPMKEYITKRKWEHEFYELLFSFSFWFPLYFLYFQVPCQYDYNAPKCTFTYATTFQSSATSFFLHAFCCHKSEVKRTPL